MKNLSRDLQSRNGVYVNGVLRCGVVWCALCKERAGERCARACRLVAAARHPLRRRRIAEAEGKLHVLRHDGHPFAVDRAEVGVLEQANQVRLRGLLKRLHRLALEAQLRVEVLGDLLHQPLERHLLDQEVVALLVPTDLTESDGARAEPVRLLDAAGGWRPTSRPLGGELLPRGLASDGHAGGLLAAGHGEKSNLDGGWVGVEVELGQGS